MLCKTGEHNGFALYCNSCTKSEVMLNVYKTFKTLRRLAEVGKLESPKISGKYDTGQLILHRVFGYRGVVLFPWLARVYDRDLPQHREGDEEPNPGVGKEVRGRTHTFYQVLIDQRDCPFIVSWFLKALTEVTSVFVNEGDCTRN